MSANCSTQAEGLSQQYPALVLNQPSQGRRVLTRIQRELAACKEFRFYVAFANQEGVISLLQTLDDLRLKNVKGRVLVSQYLNFTDPVALRTLLKLDNLEVRIATSGSMHSKGYYFRFENGVERFIIGSSNWTASALSTNTELNVQVESLSGSKIAKEIDEEFDTQFAKAKLVTLAFIESYEKIYEQMKSKMISSGNQLLRPEISEIAISVAPEVVTDFECAEADRPVLQKEISANVTSATEASEKAEVPHWLRSFGPNNMQVEALTALAKLRHSGQKRALVISATGTGKTFLSAFDVQAFNAKRMLFVVHRENIARAAMGSFRQVFGPARKFGLYTGNNRDRDADFIFCTVQTISRPDHLNQFSRDHFDYIVVDESHRTGAASYARFLNYFEPKFLLGMTATPERTDGADIFKFFDYNIAYEIRLQRALEEKMLCSFHYFGVTDLTVDGEVVEERATFNQLTAEERVKRILEKTEFYGCDDGILRGLVFCSRVEEATALSFEFNRRGYRTVALDGSSCEDDREKAIRRLEADPVSQEKLDYIFTVDIFNEGVDIPQCNQIVLLRPTQSAIIFVQQLGRGLRKLITKEKFLTVIDFIGNYTNNFLIPVALFGDRTFDKDRIRRLLVAGNEGLPGSSTINFDRIARDRIFESINNAKTQQLKDLKADFLALQTRIGRLPMMCDFIEHDLRDPFAFVDYSRSYYSFCRSVEPDEVPKITSASVKILEIYSRDALSGKTFEEPLILRQLLDNPLVSVESLDNESLKITGTITPQHRWESAARSLSLRFIREAFNNQLVSVGQQLNVSLVQVDNSIFRRGQDFNRLLEDKTFEKYLRDLVEYSILKFSTYFEPALFCNGFVRNRKYGRSDVFRILGAKENPVAQNVGGYLIDPETQAWCPIFVTYQKHESFSATTQYKDEFLDQQTLRYFTKSRRNLSSPDVKFFYSATSKQRMPLFIKKNNDEGIDFYYVGDLRPDTNSFQQQSMADDKGGSVSVVTMIMRLDKPVDEALYNYITS